MLCMVGTVWKRSRGNGRYHPVEKLSRRGEESGGAWWIWVKRSECTSTSQVHLPLVLYTAVICQYQSMTVFSPKVLVFWEIDSKTQQKIKAASDSLLVKLDFRMLFGPNA